MKTKLFLIMLMFFGICIFSSCAEEEIKPETPTLKTTGVDGIGDVETGGWE